MRRARWFAASGSAIAAASLAAIGVAAASATVTPAGQTTIRLHAPSSAHGEVTVSGTVAPSASTHDGKQLGQVALYLVGTRSDQQVSALTHPSAKGAFTLVSVYAVGSGMHEFLVQYSPVTPWTVSQTSFRYRVSG